MGAGAMRLLLLGANGQVGTSIRRRVPASVDLLVPQRAQADFADPAGLSAIVAGSGAHAVINAAAYTAVDKAESEPDLAHRVNGVAPGVLATACAAAGIPLVHVSTDYVFDGAKDGAWTEDDPVGPLGVYGASKLAGEAAVRAALAQHAILRTAWVFSDHGANFVKTMLRLGAERTHLRVVADQRGGPTPADAIADALLRLAGSLVAGTGPAGTYHFAGQPPVSWHGFATAIFAERQRLTGQAPPEIAAITTADFPTPARRPANSVLACDRIARDHGIAAPDWRQGLALVMERLLGPSADRA